MALTITDITDQPPPSITLTPAQRLLEVVETDEAGNEISRAYARITVAQERQPQSIKWTMRSWLLDQSGAFVTVAGEPVSVSPAEHVWMLGEADDTPEAALAAALEGEARRVWRTWKQLSAVI